DGFVRLYDVQARAMLPVLETQASEIVAVAISPDGGKLAALGNDKRLYIWVLAQNSPELYLAAGVVPMHRAVIGEGTRRAEYAAGRDWVRRDRLAVSAGNAA